MKQVKLYINASNTFYVKSMCKHCSSGPKKFLFEFNSFYENKDISDVKEYCSELLKKLKVNDTNFEILDSYVKNRKFKVSWLSNYLVSELNKIKVDKSKRNINDMFCCIAECNCGRTSWKFSMSSKKDITNRKCKYNFSTPEQPIIQ